MAEELGEFKHGATILALRHQVPVVPLYLGGLRALRPKGARQPVPGPVSLDVLEPFEFAPGTDLEAATGLIRNAMNAAHRARNVVPSVAVAEKKDDRAA